MRGHNLHYKGELNSDVLDILDELNCCLYLTGINANACTRDVLMEIHEGPIFSFNMDPAIPGIISTLAAKLHLLTSLNTLQTFPKYNHT